MILLTIFMKMILYTFDKIYVDQASYNQRTESEYINIALYLWDSLIREKDIYFIFFEKFYVEKIGMQMTLKKESLTAIYGMTHTSTERSTGSCRLFQLILRFSLSVERDALCEDLLEQLTRVTMGRK